jgi:hypothetical protein
MKAGFEEDSGDHRYRNGLQGGTREEQGQEVLISRMRQRKGSDKSSNGQRERTVTY